MPEKNAVVVDELKSQMSSVDLDLNKNVKLISSIVENLLSSYKSNPESFENGKGISFLSMKNILMIEYLLNLLNLTYLKSNGKKISGSSCVQRLAEIRCVLEKTKSIEVKLKYQIDKLLKIAVSSANEHDSLSFKANIDNFAKPENESDEEEEDDEDVIKKGGDEDEEEEMEGAKKDGIYRPPKLAPVYNDIDQTQEDKTRREMERLKRRAMSSSIMKEIEKEYAETPEEIKDNYANTIEYETNEHKHRVEYEEENFVRKPLVKSEMQALKRLKRGANLNSLSSFDDARVILDENINAEDFLSKKKEKKKQKSNKNKKGGKKGGKKKKIRYT